MKKVKKSTNKKAAEKSVKTADKFSKESALKALAKRPAKFFDMISKGKHNIHDLKSVGECSGGLIRKMIWAGIAEMNEDKTISLVKGIKKSNLPEVDPTPIKIKRAAKKEAREKGEAVPKVKKEKATETKVKGGRGKK